MLKCYSKKLIIAGCDEAGRGCLAGPVVAASVILPNDFNCNLINDSKLLSEKKRNNAYDIIMNKSLSYAIGIVDEKKIDKINILNASISSVINLTHNSTTSFGCFSDCTTKTHRVRNSPLFFPIWKSKITHQNSLIYHLHTEV